jgi:hypothetical protein
VLRAGEKGKGNARIITFAPFDKLSVNLPLSPNFTSKCVTFSANPKWELRLPY